MLYSQCRIQTGGAFVKVDEGHQIGALEVGE